jgi:hypothetical protein
MPELSSQTRSLRRFFLIAVAVIAALALFYFATRVPPVERAAPTVPAGDPG